MKNTVPLTYRADHNGLTEVVSALPAEWYFDAAHHEQEMKTLWQQNWLYICRAESLHEPGSFRTLTVGNQAYLLVRTPAGTLRGYHNSCRHRGSLLCENVDGTLSRSGRIVCPYHQWTYDCEDGRLLRISSFTEPVGFEKSDYGLYPLAVYNWRGFVFVHPDPDANWDTYALFQRPVDNLINFPLETMRIGRVWCTEMQCNWKTFWENFSECLHCPAVHPELTELVPMFSRRIINPKDRPDWVDHVDSDDPVYRGGLRDDAETWSLDGSAQGHTIATLTAEDLERGHSYGSTWPTAFIAGYPDHVRIVSLRPLGPETTELRAEWLFTPETLSATEYDMDNVAGFAKLVMEQDAHACELSQRGLHAAPLRAGVLMPEEYLVQRFHDWVRDGLGL